MQLVPSDTEKLLLSVAGMLARDRRERGVLLNYPEATALLSCWVIERAREGARVADLMTGGRNRYVSSQVRQ
nr:urease subunit gamma [Rhodococcus sp. YH3-3]